MPDQKIIEDLCERFEQPIDIQPIEFLLVIDNDGIILGQLKKLSDGRFTLTVDGELRGILG